MPISMATEEYRELIEKHRICIEGYTPPSKWPTRYKGIFQPLINVRFDEYVPNERRGRLPVAETKRRVVELEQRARRCLTEEVNEQTWRGDIEGEIVSRFYAEVVCSTCRKRLWDSGFQAQLHSSTEPERLQRERESRTLCTCDREARAEADFDDQGNRELFSSLLCEDVIPNPTENLEQQGIRAKRPDRVMGLRRTDILKKRTSARKDVRHSPFRRAHVLYPFLVIEAKRDKNGQGFHDIGIQTAFSITTLLKLQQDLSSRSGISLNPLVWFLANRGDFWRISGCITDGPQFRFIDLWSGTITCRDGGLQLLSNMDYICNWARDMYLPNVLWCLARGNVDVREITPAYTIASSQVPGSDLAPTCATHLTSGDLSLNARVSVDLTLDAEGDTDMRNIHVGEPDEEAATPTITDEPHSSFKSSTPNDGSEDRSRNAIIRDSDLISFSFRLLAVPEERKELEVFLEAFSMDGGIMHAARYLSQLFDENTAVASTTDRVTQLENLWTRNMAQFVSNDNVVVRAQMFFRTYLRPENEEIARDLLCVTISPRATEELFKLAGKAWPGSLYEEDIHRCPCLMIDLQSLRSMSGRELIVGESQSLNLRLGLAAAVTGEGHFRWVKVFDSEDGESKFDLWAILNSNRFGQSHNFGLQQSNVLDHVPPGNPVPHFLTQLLNEPPPARLELYRNGFDHEFCLTIFDDGNFDNEIDTGEKVIRAIMWAILIGYASMGLVDLFHHPLTALLSRIGRIYFYQSK